MQGLYAVCLACSKIQKATFLLLYFQLFSLIMKTDHFPGFTQNMWSPLRFCLMNDYIIC